MSTPIFPSSLPGVSRFNGVPVGSLLADEGVGVRAARQFSAVPGATDNVEWTFLEGELITFQNWRKVTLYQTHRWFWLKLPSAGGITWHLCRFIEKPAVKVIGHRAWTVSAKLEVRERAFEPVADPIEALDLCSLFGTSYRGFCLDMTNPASMLNAADTTASTGTFVRSLVPCGGTFGNFTCAADGPKAGSNYLETFGHTGSSVLNAAGQMNPRTNNGLTVIVAATQPASYPSGATSVRTPLAAQSATPGEQSRGPEFFDGGAEFFTFVNDEGGLQDTIGGYDIVAGNYSSSVGELSILVGTATATTLELYRNDQFIGTHVGHNNLKDVNANYTIACMWAGTNSLSFGAYIGRIYALFAIDRLLTRDEITGAYEGLLENINGAS